MNNPLHSRVCIVHDYLVQMGGAERVVLCLSKIFPSATILTSATNYRLILPEFNLSLIQNSFLQCLPFNEIDTFKKIFPLYALAFIFRPIPKNVDTVLISASSFSKLIAIRTSAKTVLYCHNPTRFLYDKSYLDLEVKWPILRSIIRLFLLPPLRILDRRSVESCDIVLANSKNVQNRILKTYGRSSTVLHPPVDVCRFSVCEQNHGYYLILSRLIAYKRIDIVIEAFNKISLPLHVVGSGTDESRLKLASSENITFFGQLTDEQIVDQYKYCKALIFPGLEDFGITPVEAQACGKPVIAYGHGGVLETVLPGTTGIFFDDQTPCSLLNAIIECENTKWDPYLIRDHSMAFSEQHFEQKLKSILCL